jgi:hypothetical protein
MVRHWWRRLVWFASESSPGGPKRATRRPAPRPRFRPWAEALEDRVTPAVTYHNGPLLAHVEVENVFLGAAWNSNPTLQQQSQQLDGYLQFLADSPYVGMLEQYSAGGQAITGGHWTGRDVYTGPVGGTITEAQILGILGSEIATGHAPPPDPNRLYVVYAPAGTLVTNPRDGDSSHFAGYHWVATDGAGNLVYYAVLPYGGSPNFLYPGLSPFQQLTEATSHELSEAITDPYPGTGWFDTAGNEIGDIVSFQGGWYDGYFVQREWSNVDNTGILPGDRKVAATGFFNSPEYQGDLVAGFYANLLHRAGSPSEISAWVNLIRANGWSDETVIGKFLASAEYANLHGGPGNDTAWVQAVYLDELGRPASGSDVDYWVPRVQSLGREQVGATIARSVEAETRMVVSYYQHYLHRPGSPAEWSYYANQIASGAATREAVQAAMVASNEYFDLQVRNTDGAHSTDKGCVDAVYLDVLGRPADPTGEPAELTYLRTGGG